MPSGPLEQLPRGFEGLSRRRSETWGETAHDASREGEGGCYGTLLKSELLDTSPKARADRGKEQEGRKLRAKNSLSGVKAGRVTLGGALAKKVPTIGFKRGKDSFGIRFGTKYTLSTAALAAMKNSSRRIGRRPFKQIHAKNLMDDFYRDLIDWSIDNVVAIGLGSTVYLWRAHMSIVTKLCDLGDMDGTVFSVSWSLSGKELAVGTSKGMVYVWDTTSCMMLRAMDGHESNVCRVAWSSDILSSGGGEGCIFNRDLRSPASYLERLSGSAGHQGGLCGLKWSPDEEQLASGGNDNLLLVWSARKTSGILAKGFDSSRASKNASRQSSSGSGPVPLLSFAQHTAAVKAIAWSPHERGLLASGGGNGGNMIYFLQAKNNTSVSCADTGSQVTNLYWSKNVNELVSTHGFSHNQIVVWRYPNLSRVVTLAGDWRRVIYLAVSPNGETIVAGGGDEMLRFWNLFPPATIGQRSMRASVLSPERMFIR